MFSRLGLTAAILLVGGAGSLAAQTIQLAPLTDTEDYLDPARHRSAQLFLALEPVNAKARDVGGDFVVRLPEGLPTSQTTICVRAMGRVAWDLVKDMPDVSEHEGDHIYFASRNFEWPDGAKAKMGAGSLDSGNFDGAVDETVAGWARVLASLGDCDRLRRGGRQVLLASYWKGEPDDAKADADTEEKQLRLFIDTVSLQRLTLTLLDDKGNDKELECRGPIKADFHQWECDFNAAELPIGACFDAALTGQPDCRKLYLTQYSEGGSETYPSADLLP